ncbi:MAG: hypothetical protein HYX28_05440 [Candidatus Koribacter versatilis]|uniref:Uncharacterized protein n=1 Tax=Candidatus Korobacter versatilis TaxID=658062 RepID=A0A932A7M0_9BACT|nr:hypothetical protein [Candidatus Koribacter versatilis]
MSNLARSRHTPRCCHVKTNGLHCGSPALRGNVLCFFHDKWLANAADDILPPLEDGNGVQFSLMYVVARLRKEAFRDGRADIPAVKQLLYALQTASNNLRHCNFDPQLKRSTTSAFADPDQDDNAAGDDRVAQAPSPVAVDLDVPRKPVGSIHHGDAEAHGD